MQACTAQGPHSTCEGLAGGVNLTTFGDRVALRWRRSSTTAPSLNCVRPGRRHVPLRCNNAGLHTTGPPAQTLSLSDQSAPIILDSDDESPLPAPKRQRRRYHVPVDSDEDTVSSMQLATPKVLSTQGPSTTLHSATQVQVTESAALPPSQDLLAIRTPAPAGPPPPPTPSPEEDDKGPYYCHPCKHDYETSSAFKQHQRSKKHSTAINRMEMNRAYREDFDRRMAERDAAASASQTESLDSVPQPSRRRLATQGGSIIIVSDDESSPEVLAAPQSKAAPIPGPKGLFNKEVS